MATRMQQRRGTAAQWTSANPVLAAGEIGFETDTNKFKVGNGSTAWASLTYFVDASVAFDSSEVTSAINSAIANVIDGAPEVLNTLNELAAAVNDDENFAIGILNSLSVIDNALAVLGNQDASMSNTLTELDSSLETINDNLDSHLSQTTNVHGILDTSDLVVSADIANLVTQTEIDNSITTHNGDTTNVHGIANTAVLVVQNDLSTAISNHNAVTTNVHGIADTADLATESYADGAVSTHAALTASHGVSGAIVGTSDTQELSNKTISYANNTITVQVSNVSDLTATAAEINVLDGILANVTELNYLDGVTSNVQAQLDAKAALAGAAFTGNISTTGDLTVDGNFTVNGSNVLVSATQIQVEDTLLQLGHQNAGNTTDLGLVVGYTDGSAKHAGIVKDITDGKWKLFKDLTVEPSTTVDFSSATLDTLVLDALEATYITMGNVSSTEIGYLNGVTSEIQTQINSKAPTASPTFTGLVTVAANGIAFTDGTQTKEGVPSRTTILQKTASYTLSDVAERDELLEMGSSSAVTVTIPADSSVNFPVGTSIDVLQTGTGQVTIAGAGGVTVNGTPGLKLRAQWSSATLFKRAANTWVVMGDLTA